MVAQASTHLRNYWLVLGYLLCMAVIQLAPRQAEAQAVDPGPLAPKPKPAPSAPAPPPLDLGPLKPKSPSPPVVPPPSPIPVPPSPPPVATPATPPAGIAAWLGPLPPQPAAQVRNLASTALGAGLIAVDDGTALQVAQAVNVKRRFRQRICGLGGCRDQLRDAGTVTVTREWVGTVVPVGGPEAQPWLAIALVPVTRPGAEPPSPPPPGWTAEQDPAPPVDFVASSLGLLRAAKVDMGGLCSRKPAYALAIQPHLTQLCLRPAAPLPRAEPAARRPHRDDSDDGRIRPGWAGQAGNFSWTAAQVWLVEDRGQTRLEWAASLAKVSTARRSGIPTLTRLEIGSGSPLGLLYTADLLLGPTIGNRNHHLTIQGGVGVSGYSGDTIRMAVEVPVRVQVGTILGDSFLLAWAEPAWAYFTNGRRKQGSEHASFADQLRIGAWWGSNASARGKFGIGAELLEISGARVINLMVGSCSWN